MRAAVCTRYGPPEVLRVKDVEKPVPKDDQILVRVRATTVTSGDARVRRADPFVVRLFMGFTRPRTPILGSELAGEVEAVGTGATRFKVGDQVFGSGVSTCAEYTCVRDAGARALKPANMTFEEAAAIPFGGLSALHFLKAGNVGRGQKVLVYGASGSVGTAAVQIAKHLGAEVTGVCSTTNLGLVTSLGADRVVDYTREDFARPGAYDVVFDTVGKTSFSSCMRSLRKGGVYLSAVAIAPMLRRLRASLAGRKFVGGIAKPKAEDIAFLKGLIEAGALRAVIDRRYPLEQIAEAHRYVDTGRKRGNVVITVAGR